MVVTGVVAPREALEKAALISRGMTEKVEDLLAVGTKRTVLVEVEFVEVSSGASKLVGIKPPAAVVSTPGTGVVYQVVRPLPGDHGTQPVHSLSGTAGASTDFSASARFDDSYARVLA